MEEDSAAEVSREITRYLNELASGSPEDSERLFDLLYRDLRSAARRELRRSGQKNSFWTTEVVHEAYARIFAGREAKWDHRRHFLGVAAQVMRRLLVDHARMRGRKKRSPKGDRVPLECVISDLERVSVDMLDLDEALEKLRQHDPRAAQVVELRFFLQLTMEEIAAVIGVPKRSLERDWAYARVWLKRELH
jgi:RNA polymerase sigma factor (TIGR02999 family)